MQRILWHELAILGRSFCGASHFGKWLNHSVVTISMFLFILFLLPSSDRICLPYSSSLALPFHRCCRSVQINRILHIVYIHYCTLFPRHSINPPVTFSLLACCSFRAYKLFFSLFSYQFLLHFSLLSFNTRYSVQQSSLNKFAPSQPRHTIRFRGSSKHKGRDKLVYSLMHQPSDGIIWHLSSRRPYTADSYVYMMTYFSVTNNEKDAMPRLLVYGMLMHFTTFCFLRASIGSLTPPSIANRSFNLIYLGVASLHIDRTLIYSDAYGYRDTGKRIFCGIYTNSGLLESSARIRAIYSCIVCCQWERQTSRRASQSSQRESSLSSSLLLTLVCISSKANADVFHSPSSFPLSSLPANSFFSLLLLPPSMRSISLTLLPTLSRIHTRTRSHLFLWEQHTATLLGLLCTFIF